jgi:site-specific DNA-methyltransferase (adenine-specific)
MTNWTINNQDVMEWVAQYQGEPFHALLCDPPYHLTGQHRRLMGRDGQHRERNGKGFMGKAWDGGDIAFRPETWAALAQHLHPGAFLMAFAASRGWHRQATAMEDAGLIIHPTIWRYTTDQGETFYFDSLEGFENFIATAAADPGVLQERQLGPLGFAFGSGFPKGARVQRDGAPHIDFTGHRYGLQTMKPAVEPIILAQKPFERRPFDDITRTGAGALFIDAGRVGDSGGTKASHQGEFKYQGIPGQVHATRGYRTGHQVEEIDDGRWPANLILEDGAAAALDAQTGILTSGKPVGVRKTGNRTVYRADPTRIGTPITGYGDSGGASRFFFKVAEQIDLADPLYYCAKASQEERNAGLDHLPKRQKVYNGQSGQSAGLAPGSVEDKFTTQPAANSHPTVKPLGLTKYLATLLLPPSAYAPRRILIPFAGVMSEAIGAMKAGWDEIVAVEREAEYVTIGKARMRYWQLKFEGSLFANLDSKKEIA